MTGDAYELEDFVILAQCPACLDGKPVRAMVIGFGDADLDKGKYRVQTVEHPDIKRGGKHQIAGTFAPPELEPDESE